MGVKKKKKFISRKFKEVKLFHIFRGRLKHGRHFTFKSVMDVSAVTLVSPAVAGAFVDASCPYAVRGPWLQVLIPDDFLPTLVEDLADLADPDEVSFLYLYSAVD